jgi:hypothetical protein
MGMNAKRVSDASFPGLESRVLRYVESMRWRQAITGQSLTIQMIQDRARIEAAKEGIDASAFKASNGWVQRFRARYRLGAFVVAGGEHDKHDTNGDRSQEIFSKARDRRSEDFAHDSQQQQQQQQQRVAYDTRDAHQHVATQQRLMRQMLLQQQQEQPHGLTASDGSLEELPVREHRMHVSEGESEVADGGVDQRSSADCPPAARVNECDVHGDFVGASAHRTGRGRIETEHSNPNPPLREARNQPRRQRERKMVDDTLSRLASAYQHDDIYLMTCDLLFFSSLPGKHLLQQHYSFPRLHHQHEQREQHGDSEEHSEQREEHHGGVHDNQVSPAYVLCIKCALQCCCRHVTSYGSPKVLYMLLRA